jgi:hypothetical protein
MTALRLAAAFAVLTACTDLGSVQRDVCGNGVIEPSAGEDCDGADGCGPPDGELACRILCDTATPCPGSAACGLDGSCHAPGTTFTAAASTTWNAPHLIVGDTTGDGYPELVGVAAQHVDVRLGSRDLALSAVTLPSPPLSGTPRSADLEDDGDDDLVIPVGAGVFALTGSSSSVLEPFLYNSFDSPAEGRIVAATVTFADLLSLPVLAARESSTGLSIVAFVGDVGPAGLAPFPAGRNVDEVVGDELPVGRLVDGSLTARNIALPFDTGRAVALYDAAVVGLDTLTMTARTSVMLPVGVEVRRGAWFADFDGDGHQDLVVSVDIGTVEGLAVAWGQGNGNLVDSGGVANQATVVWRSDRDQDGGGGNDGPLEPVMVAQVTDNLAILGDENDADVIGARGLYTTQCVLRNQCALYLLRPSTRDWTGAVVADVNGDDRPDVAAFVGNQTGIDLLLNTATTLLFNDASVPTSGAVERIILGDFDGDTISDLAYVDAVVGVPFTDSISVAFGQALGPPSAPVLMGPVGELVAGGTLLATSTSGQIDWVDDLVVVTDRDIAGPDHRGAAILFGSTARRLVAPLLPEAIPRNNRSVDATVVDDVFVFDGNGDAYADLVVLTTTSYGGSTMGDVEGTAPLQVRHARRYVGLSDGQADETTALELIAGNGNLAGARWLGADVLAAGNDEAIAVRQDGGLVVVRLDGGCSGAACLTGVAAPAASLSDPVTVQAADVDADGDLDLMAVMRNRAPGSTSTRDASVVIWWNQDGFAPERAQVIGGDLADAVLVDLDRDGRRELVLLARARAGSPAEASGLSVARLTGGGFGEATALAAAADGVTLASADVNGDRLEDLIVVAGVERSTPRELTVYLQDEARIPTSEE